MSKEQEWFLFSFNRAKSWTGVCVWVSESVRARVCTSVSGSECEHVCVCVWELVCVCTCGCDRVLMCKRVCVVACLTEGQKERRCLENLKNQSADWTQLPPSASAFLLESPQSRLFLIFHMTLTQSPHFQGPRMECAPSRRALSHVWLSRLFKRQETGGWFSAHGLIWIHISPYTHSCIPCP